MKTRLFLLILVVASCAVRADELDQKIEAARARLASLQEEVEPLARPILIEDAGLRAWVSGRMLDAVLKRYNSLLPDQRKFTYQSSGADHPLMRGGSAWPLHCGWEVELRDGGAFRVRAWPTDLKAAWNGFGNYRLDGRLKAEADVHIRGRIFFPEHVWKCVTSCYEVCEDGVCSYKCNTECYWVIMPCSGNKTENSATAGATFEIHPPPLCTPQYCPELTIRPLDELEKAILLNLRTEAASRQDLADRVSASLVDVEARLPLLVKADLVAEASTIALTPAGRVFAKSIAGGFIYKVSENHAQGTGKVDICVDLVVLKPCIQTDVTLPVGTLYAGAVSLGFQQDAALDYPDGYKFSKMRHRSYQVSFTPTQSTSTSTGIEARGNVRVEWTDLVKIEDNLRAHYIDVGTGDAIVIQTPVLPDGTRGKTVVIDTGPRRDSPRTTFLENRSHIYLNGIGIRRGDRIDYLILTHDDPRHIAGIMDILDDYEVATVVQPKVGKSRKYKALIRRVAAETAGGQPTQILNLRDGIPELDLGPLVRGELLSPRPADIGKWDGDDASIVLRVDYGNRRLLFTGDIKSQAETRLLNDRKADLAADVLKAANHGAAKSSMKEFIEAVNPDVAVFSAGSEWVHLGKVPAKQVLDRFRLAAPSATLLSTKYEDPAEPKGVPDDGDGDDVLVVTDGQRLRAFHQRDQQGLREWILILDLP
jgi:competence protein ComEC